MNCSRTREVYIKQKKKKTTLFLIICKLNLIWCKIICASPVFCWSYFISHFELKTFGALYAAPFLYIFIYLFFFFFFFFFKSQLFFKHAQSTVVLLNPDVPCLCKQCRSRSAGFWRSQLIWICTVCHSVVEFVSITRITKTDWLKIRSGRGIFIQHE